MGRVLGTSGELGIRPASAKPDNIDAPQLVGIKPLKNGFPHVHFIRPTNLGTIGPGFFRCQSQAAYLVAEDSLDGRETMRTLLNLKGYDVIVAEEGVQAIELA